MHNHRKNTPMKLPIRFALAAFAVLSTASLTSQASFHLWKFDEVFSNASGTVQFIEMTDPSDFEGSIGGFQVKSSTNTFTVPSNLPTTSTMNHHLLFATSNFASLPGGVAPDFFIPANFFNPAGDFLDWAGGFDHQTFGAIPTDGVTSRTIPGSFTQPNSPTNFAGNSGSVTVPEPLAVALLMFSVPAAFARRRRRCS